jgi:hypothetical protein
MGQERNEIRMKQKCPKCKKQSGIDGKPRVLNDSRVAPRAGDPVFLLINCIWAIQAHALKHLAPNSFA